MVRALRPASSEIREERHAGQTLRIELLMLQVILSAQGSEGHCRSIAGVRIALTLFCGQVPGINQALVDERGHDES
ncbi:hypothetical protein D3C73_1532380 [compost metagenome]